MTQKTKLLPSIILGLIGAIFLFELIRDAKHPGDFIGYVHAGNAVLSGNDIYADYLNTWPPFFAICSVPLALLDAQSTYTVRFIWLLGMLIALFFSIRITIRLVHDKALVFGRVEDQSTLPWTSAIVWVPLLLLLRFILDNLSNVQINIYLLYAALASIVLFAQKKNLWGGLILGFIISIKVYPIFILFYFLYKRAFKPVIWSLFFILLLNSISFWVFGWELAIDYYRHWAYEVVPYAHFQDHKNQSIFGVFLRFFTAEDPGNNMYVNVMSLAPESIKRYTYIVIALFALIPAYLFRRKLKDYLGQTTILEYAVLFTAIPLITPVAWKMNFVFLWLPCFLVYGILFQQSSLLHVGKLKLLRTGFIIAMALLILSSELFIGHYLSDLTEAYGFITIGTLILLFIQLYIYQYFDKFLLR